MHQRQCDFSDNICVQVAWRACIGRKEQTHQAVRQASKRWMMIFHMTLTA